MLAAILAIATALRVREATLTPFWFDEIFTLWTVRLGVPGMFRLLAQDMHPPLHSLLVWGWRAIGGEGELWLKSLSIAIGLCTIAAVYGIARAMFGVRAALLAAGLLALHRTAVIFSQEVRSYGLLWLLLVLATWMAWRWIEHGRRRDAVLFVLCAAAALYTHYLAGVVLAFMFMWGGVALHRDRARLLDWLWLHLAIALMFAPQLPTFVEQLRRNREHWVKPSTLSGLFNLGRQISIGATYLVVPWFLAAALPLGREREWRGASLLWCVALFPIALTWGLTRGGAHLFVERYMFFTLPVWCALVAAGIAGVRWRAARWIGAIGLVALDARSFALHHPFPESVAQHRAVEYLAARVRPGDLVYCADSHSLFTLEQHLPGRARYRFLLSDPHLPYYEGAYLIPDSIRVTEGDVERAHVRGERWWGMRTRHGGITSVPAAVVLGSFAIAVPIQYEMVTVWVGQADSARVGAASAGR
jgi:hypothetical protein